MTPDIEVLMMYVLGLHVVALPLFWLGRRLGVQWHVAEYVLLYIGWGMLFGFAVFMYDSIGQMMQSMDVSMGFLKWTAAIAGVFSAISLLPRMLFRESLAEHPVLTTTISSALVATLYLKVVVMIFTMFLLD